MAKKESVKDAKVVEKEEVIEETTKVEEVEKETKKEEVKKEEKKNNDTLKVVLKRTWDIIFWCLVLIVLGSWIVDFVNTKQSKDPQLCIKKETIETEKGKVDSCLGLGYKVFTYHTTNMEGAREFGPFWSEPRK